MADETTVTASATTSEPAALATSQVAALTTSQASALTVSTAEPLPVEAPKSALDRLEEFEQKLFGNRIQRFAGEIEKGIGSLFSDLLPSQKAHHAALGTLAGAEQEAADAQKALDAANTKLKAAQDAAAETETAANKA